MGIVMFKVHANTVQYGAEGMKGEWGGMTMCNLALQATNWNILYSWIPSGRH